MTKLSHNLAAKIAAVFLFVFLMLGALASLFGSLYVIYQDWDRDGLSYYDTEQCLRITEQSCFGIARAAAEGCLDQAWIEAYLYPGNMRIESFWAVDLRGNEIILELPLSAGEAAVPLPDPAGESLSLYVRITDTDPEANMGSETPALDSGEKMESFYNEE
ncbi:MAG: hypothetical protein Q4B50_02315, partial [Bacillota bacterium]|nr:hypothetical protein [Bacillota bacterium]